MINPISPKYFDRGGISTRRFIVAHKLGSLEGSIIKYVDRYQFKDGLQDLLKARDCLNYLIKEVRKNERTEQKIQVRSRVQTPRGTDKGNLGLDTSDTDGREDPI